MFDHISTNTSKFVKNTPLVGVGKFGQTRSFVFDILGSFRFDYEYEIEYEYYLRISSQWRSRALALHVGFR